MSTCEICGFSRFTLNDGLYYCAECGSQSQALREELTEAVHSTEGSRQYLHQLRKKKTPRSLKEDRSYDPLFDDSRVLELPDILQVILRAQCKALVSIGVDRTFEATVRLLWFKYALDVKDWTVQTDSGDGQGRTILVTVSLLYIALVYTRTPVTLMELVRYAEEGTVPYYGLESILPQRYLTQFTNQLLPRYGLTVSRIQRQCRQLYLSLSLPRGPAANIEDIAAKLVDRLHLPSCVGRCVQRLLLSCSLDTRGCFQEHRGGHHKFNPPEVTCMAALFVVLKMLYILDDIHEFSEMELIEQTSDEGQTSDEEHYLYSWSDWVLVYVGSEEQRITREQRPLYSKETPRLKSFRDYADFCKNVVYRSFRVITKYRIDPSLTSDLERNVSRASEATTRNRLSLETAYRDIKPRIRLQDCVTMRTDKAPYYESTALSQSSTLSRSVEFLLEVCCEAIPIDRDAFVSEVVSTEKTLQMTLITVDAIGKLFF